MKKQTIIFLLFVALGVLSISKNTFAVTNFTRNLYQGVTGDDVILLQKILNSSPDTIVSPSGVGSKGFESNYFGQKTKEAVIKFQNKYGSQILTPNNLVVGNGFVGGSTRAVLNSLLTPAPGIVSANQVAAPIVAPSITSIEPQVLNDGDVLIINGKGFTDHNNIVILGEDQNKYSAIKSTDGGTKISFAFLSTVGERFRKGLAFSLSKIPQNNRQFVINKLLTGYRKDNGEQASNDKTMLVPLTLRVENENGVSTTTSFTINIFTNIQ